MTGKTMKATSDMIDKVSSSRTSAQKMTQAALNRRDAKDAVIARKIDDRLNARALSVGHLK